MKNAEKGAKKCKRGPFRLFQHPFSCKTPKKQKGDPLKTLNNFEKKSHRAEKGAEKVS